MRYIKRLPEPDILVQKRDEWQKKFEEKKAKNATAGRILRNMVIHPYGRGWRCVHIGNVFIVKVC